MWRQWPASHILAVFNTRAKLPILIISQPSLPSSIGGTGRYQRRVVEAKTLANGVGEDGTEQPDTATGDTTPTTNDRQTAWLGLLPGGCLARGDVVHEAIDIITRDRGHRLPASKGTMWRTIRPRSEISIFPSYETCKAQPTVVEGQKP